MKSVIAAAAALLLAGCASVGIDEALRDANTRAAPFTQGQLELSRTQDQLERRAALAEELLAQPLSEDAAVRLALANSPALQALLAQHWAELAAANQLGRLPNPVFSFERMRLGQELEIGRMLSFGLLDLLLLPQRISVAQSQAEAARLQLSGAVVEQVTQVRQAWVRAVAARQSVQYAQQVQEAAAASAELARRMQQVGNFSKLQRARQQVFHADATTQLALARQLTDATREALVRALGLTDAQTAALKLPERLPDLPQAPREAAEVAASAGQQRLDLQLARAQLDAAGKSQGLNLLATYVDAQLGLRHDSLFDNTHGERATRRGFELDIALPLFDWGSARRDQLDARSLAAASRYEAIARGASSQLRESYSAYRTAWDIARHYRWRQLAAARELLSLSHGLGYRAPLPRRDRAAAPDHAGREHASLQRHADRRVRAAGRSARTDCRRAPGHRGAAAVLAGRCRPGRGGDRQAHFPLIQT